MTVTGPPCRTSRTSRSTRPPGRSGPGDRLVTTVTRRYVLRLVPGTDTAGPYLGDSWTGTRTDSTKFRRAGD